MKIHVGRSHRSGFRDKEALERLYHEEMMTLDEIADHFGVSYATIQKWCSKHDIDTRDKKDPSHPPYHTFYRRHDTVGAEYEYVRTSIDGELKLASIHRLVAYAHGIIDAQELFDTHIVVHHKSEHGLDNRPDNLERMERGEHMAHHHALRRGE